MLGGVGEQELRVAVGDEPRSEASGAVQRCAHCGRAFAGNAGPGRPAKYCRRSCRQRAFEARRHIGDQAWVEERLVRLAEQLAEYEDAVDRVREVIGELRVDLEDGHSTGLAVVIERLDAAIGPVSTG